MDVHDNYVFMDCFHTLLLLDAKNGYITRKFTVASYCAEDIFLLKNNDIIF